MKNLSILPFLFVMMFFAACDKDDTDDTPVDTHDELYVKFTNEPTSDVSIIGMQMRPHGRADEDTGPTGDWGDNIIPGITLAPGDHTFFTLKIPNLNRWEYRLTIKDADGNSVNLWELPYWGDGEYFITHWGGDDRTAYVTVRQDPETGHYWIQGWGGHAGIE